MSEQDHATSSMNVSGTCRDIGTPLTRTGSLAVLAADLERMRPFMERSMRLLQEAGR